MHIIQDLESLIKNIEETVYHWFGTGKTGEEGKDAIKDIIISSTSPIISGAIMPIEAPTPAVIVEPAVVETAPIEPVIEVPIVADPVVADPIIKKGK